MTAGNARSPAPRCPRCAELAAYARAGGADVERAKMEHPSRLEVAYSLAAGYLLGRLDVIARRLDDHAAEHQGRAA